MPTPALAASTAARAMPTTKVSEIFMTVTREGGRGGLQKPPAWPPVRISADSYKAGPSDYGACLRSEEHTSELQSLMRISYAVFCLKKKQKQIQQQNAKKIKISMIENRHRK